MRKDHRSASSRSFNLTIVNQFILLLIFCFAGNVAGSCLSYGHSCWGAHGKRNYHDQNAEQQRVIVDGDREGGPIGVVETDSNAPAANSRGRWILSRLITGRLTVPASALTDGTRSTGSRWHKTQNNIVLPGNEDTGYDFPTNEFYRDKELTINGDSNEDSKESTSPLDLTRKIREPYVAANLLFLPSRLEYDRRMSRAQKYKLSTILDESSDGKL